MDLTRDEWLALASFLTFLHPDLFSNVSPMISEETKERAVLAEQAKEKFIKIAKQMEEEK